jgi:hypothetical protein
MGLRCALWCKAGKRDLTRRWGCAHGTYFGGADDFRLWPILLKKAAVATQEYQ